MAELIPVEAAYEVYLVDPGVRASHVITLVQEVTRRSTPECAALVHDAPALVAGFATRQAAEEQAAPEPPPPSVIPQPRVPVAIGLILLGVIQLGVAIWWLLPKGDLGGRHV